MVKKLGWIGLVYNLSEHAKAGYEYLNHETLDTKDYKYGTYSGEMKNNEPHGKGHFIYFKKHGVFDRGDEYIGEYLNGRKHGIGVWKHKKNGKKEKCFYKYGARIK